MLALAACAKKECETSANCEAGTVCSATHQCIPVSCFSSNDCPVRSWCNPDTGGCEEGCLNDTDCLPSEHCDVAQRSCYTPGCRGTQLDCSFGEFCNALSGTCYPAGGYYCLRCERNEDCGGANNYCLRLGGSLDPFCGVDCSAGQECPRGYDCVPVRTTGDVTLAYQCIAPCWELDP
jgi:hypothetical protein